MASWIILSIIGISSGGIISSGLFSFIISLGIISKFADCTRTGDRVRLYENAIALGGIIGSLLLVYQISYSIDAIIGVVLARCITGIFGLCAGIFVGCWAMSIAEVINIFPVFIRRIKLVYYIKYIVVAIALGKGIGMWIMALYYV